MISNATTRYSTLLLILLLGATACSGDPVHTPRDTGTEEDAREDIDTADATEDADTEVEEDVPPPGPPEIDISPETITFSDVDVGESYSTVVTIRNLGEGPLSITDAQLNQFGVSGSSVFSAGDNWPNFPVVLEQNTFRDLHVIYTPTEPGAHRGEFVLFSTDPDENRISLRIETISATPEIEVAKRINFGTVEPGNSSEPQRLEIYNRGLTPLVVETMEFDYQRPGSNVFSTEVIASADVDSLPVQLDRNHFFYIDVTFTPTDDETERADLILESTDPGNSPTTISLSANVPEPCLQTSGDINFEANSSGNTSPKELILFNCSLTQSLEITDLELVDDGGGVFEFADPVDDNFTIPTLDTQEISIRATITGEQEVVGLISFSSSDPSADVVEHQLRARPYQTDE